MKPSERLSSILHRHDLSISAAARLSGISQPYLSRMLAGSRPISQKNWLKILEKIEGLSAHVAQAQMAQWQIEEAQATLSAYSTGSHSPVVVVSGSGNTTTVQNGDQDLIRAIVTADPQTKQAIRHLLKTHKS